MLSTILLAALIPQGLSLPSQELTSIEVLTPSVPVYQFGTLLSVDEDGDRCAVQAWAMESNFDDWRIFVFERTGAGWSERQLLLPPFPAPGFPRDLALHGDRLVLSAGAFNDHALYVYEADGAGTWSSTATLVPANGNPSGSFGRAVTLTADRIMAGASSDDTFGQNAGAVHVFAPDVTQPSGWLEEPLLSLPSGLDSSFGGALDASASRLIVGGLFEAHLFDRSPSGPVSWTYAASLPISGSTRSGGVAVADDVAAVGDINHLGDNPLLAGAAHVFEETAGGPGAWGPTASMFPKISSVFFGEHVDINGTYMLVLDPVSSQIPPQLQLFRRVVKAGPDTWRRSGFLRDACRPAAQAELAGGDVLAGVPTFAFDQGAVFVYRLLDLSMVP